MGLFGPSVMYSTQEYSLSELEVEKLVSYTKVHTLNQENKDLVRSAILGRRHGDGKISLQQIYETLLSLKDIYKISKEDKNGLMEVFKQHYKEHFGV